MECGLIGIRRVAVAVQVRGAEDFSCGDDTNSFFNEWVF